ncbi:nuclear RNase [Scheffersomyces coipomensis]|uniref:nuclear RNase n=1 Tax=Scheffersomyces coipomensis TaxID=1788519 RepID=UPI00315CE8CC
MPPPRPPINAKKARLYNSRNIRTHTTDASLVDKDKLNVPDFLNAREFEIKSFELAQLNSKYASSNRAFQSLPRVLRRRAASHNVKRIPKRLRAKAIREMKSSMTGTPTVIKKKHSRGRELYRLTMSRKLLNLGSKLKLLKGVPDKEVYGKKLNLRSKIKALSKQIRALKQLDTEVKSKLNNIVGSYDNTGINDYASRPTGNIKYYKRQRQFVWLPTHIWHAKRFHMIKQHGFQIPLSPTQKCFKMMSRQSKNDSILFDTSYYTSLIIELENDEDYESFLLNITKFSKSIPEKFLNGERSYNDWIYLDGQKIGKVLIFSHIQSHKILIRCFPSIYKDIFDYCKNAISNYTPSAIHDCQYSLGSLDLIGPLSLLSLSKVLHLVDKDSSIKKAWSKLSTVRDSKAIPIGFNISFDIMDSRLWKQPMKIKPSSDTNEYFDFVSSLSTSKLVDSTTIENLLTPEGRTKSYENQMSIKEIDREFTKIATRENSLIDTDIQHRSITPILISKIGPSSWTLIAPWFWILPIWSKLVRVSQIKPGGIRQIRQYNFERGCANFPNDYPWLRDGWNYNEALGEIKQKKYTKLPKRLVNDKRPDYKDIDIISPFKCDWNFLRNITFLAKLAGKDLNQLEINPKFAIYEDGNPIRELNSTHDLKRQCHELKSLALEGIRKSVIPIEIFNKKNEFQNKLISGDYTVPRASEIRFSRLPVIQISLELIKNGKLHDGARIYLSKVEPDDDVSIIGFVTSGAYNINLGIASGIGLVRADILKDSTITTLYVRNIGQTSIYEAKITTIHN